MLHARATCAYVLTMRLQLSDEGDRLRTYYALTYYARTYYALTY